MRAPRQRWILTCLFLIVATSVHAQDPLPSWNDSASKQAITKFIAAATTKTSPDYIPVAERIAVFDNDGTLWTETPVYFQVFFIFDRIKQLAKDHPEWKTQEPFASVLKDDIKGALAGGEHGLLDMMAATHAGMTTVEFQQMVANWIANAKHPKTERLYTLMVFQPMLELLDYLRANGFKTYIVSGGGVEFMRAWATPVYGIPPEQIIGSRVKTAFEIRNGEPVLVRQPDIAFLDDKEGKPIAINDIIGRRPAMAFGNSDGDLAMLQWTMAGDGKRLAAIVHHTDAKRETAYDRGSHVGKLDKALDIAKNKGWTLIDMEQDWKTIYPPLP